MNELEMVRFSELAPDRLSEVHWAFYLFRDHFVLDHYEVCTRPTARHRFESKVCFDRIHGRDNTIDVAGVPLTPDIRAKVRAEVVNRVMHLPVLLPTSGK